MKENSMNLWKNSYKEDGDKKPDYTGKAKVNVLRWMLRYGSIRTRRVIDILAVNSERKRRQIAHFRLIHTP